MSSDVAYFVVQLRDDASLDQGGKGSSVAKWLDSGYSLYFLLHMNYGSVKLLHKN